MRNFGKIQMPIILNLVLSLTKFSIVIGSTNAYLLRNRRINPWASIYEHPISISIFSNWISVVRCPRYILVNKLRWIAVPYILKVAEHSFRGALADAIQHVHKLGLQKQTCRWYSDHFICSKPALPLLFFFIIERSVLMALVFYNKGMLEKVTMQRTQQFSDFSISKEPS